MKVRPLGKRVLVELDPVQEKQSKGGIQIADKHSEKVRTGTVLEIGDEVERFKVGDKVFMSYYVGLIVYLLDLGWHNDIHRIVSEEEIPAKLIEE